MATAAKTTGHKHADAKHSDPKHPGTKQPDSKHPDPEHPDPKHNVGGARQAYYERISRHDMAPLWEKLRQLVGNEPKTVCAPAIWRFKDVRAMVMESGELISAQE